MLGIRRTPAVSLDPTMPAPAETEDTDTKPEEQQPQSAKPTRLREARSAKVAPSPSTGEPYTPTTAPSFLTLKVPGPASYTPEDGAGKPGSPHGVVDLTPVHRLTNILDEDKGTDR